VSQTPAAGAPRRRWLALAWIVPLVVVVVVAGVLVARWLRDGPLAEFLATYSGSAALPAWAPVGFPAWLGWQHALNALFLLFVVRSGVQLRRLQRPRTFWTRRNTGPLRTRNPPRRIPLELWLHLTMDTLFVLNGAVFYVLLFATGQWVRIVPTSWEVVPQAVSAAVQYASMDWPTEDGWVNYNALQLLSYFFVVFLLAPAAIATGLRMSPAATQRRVPGFPLELARRAHWPIMVIFLVFVAVHVVLVLTTGALRNLNHLYGGSDSETSWAGAVVFAASVVVMAAAWIGARPVVLRAIAGRMGTVVQR
jgi:hypothetical protein